MRRWSIAVVVVAACAGGDSQPTNPNGGSSARTGTGSSATPAPPARPPAPFDKAAYDAISKLDFAGAPTQVMELSDSGLALRVSPTPATGEQPMVATIRLGKCLNCVEIRKAAWVARTAELAQLLPKEVRDKPDTVFEVSDATVAGTPVIYVYQLAVFAIGGLDGKPLEKAINTHAYTLHWNDGVNQVQISVKDGSPPDSPTVEQLAAKVPRARIEKLAADLFVAIEPYIHGK
jgi:hypothetical protein